MSLEYRITTLNDSYLKELGKELRFLNTISDGKMYFSKEIKKTKSERNALKTKEYEEFKKVYPSVNGIYDDKFIVKYNKLVTEGLHQTIIDSVELYKKELDITKKPIANASTYINQKRYLQDFKVIKDKKEEWINEILKYYPSKTIEKVLEQRKERLILNPKKDFTEGVLKNILDKYK